MSWLRDGDRKGLKVSNCESLKKDPRVGAGKAKEKGLEGLIEMPGNRLRSKVVYSMLIQQTFIKAYSLSGLVLSSQGKKWSKTWSSGGDRFVNSNCSTIKGTTERHQRDWVIPSPFPTGICWR